MPAYRRKRSLGCEQLERKIAPSSVLFGAGKRASLQDAQAFDATQVEQAAFYLAASAVLSQSTNVANVAPVTLDQPAVAAGEAAISKPSSPLTSYGDGTPPFPGAVWQIKFFSMTTTGCKAEWGWDSLETIDLGDLDTLPVLRVIDKQPADDSGSTPDIPSVEPISPETPSEQSNDADAVGAVPSEEQAAGGDDVAAEDFPPVIDDTLVAGDEVADPVAEDTGLPDDAYADDTSWYADDFEDLGPVDTEHANEDFTGSNSPGEDCFPVSDDAPVDGDEWAEPVAEDTALPDDTYADDTSWYADDFEDLGPVDSEYADEEFPVVDDGSSENASESDVVECHSDDAVVGADGSGLFNSEMAED
jgi:hypothetical protein